MNGKRIQVFLSALLCLVLLAAAGMSTAAAAETAGAAEAVREMIPMDGTREAPTVLGDGETVFLFGVIDDAGQESWFEIHTDKTTVGEALAEQALVEGEQTEYGLFVQTVCGISAIYDEGFWWQFEVDGEASMMGVDSTDITDQAVYTFRKVPA